MNRDSVVIEEKYYLPGLVQVARYPGVAKNLRACKGLTRQLCLSQISPVLLRDYSERLMHFSVPANG